MENLREYLLDQGYRDINSPRATLKQAFDDGIISSQDWLTMLADDNTAAQIFSRIRLHYLDSFNSLIHYLTK